LGQRLSWKEVAAVFQTSWDNVFHAVQMAVDWGRAHQDLSDITAIGVDEVQWQRGHRYLTLVYQIDTHCKRLLWVGKERKVKTLLGFFRWFGAERSAGLKFVCSDMWKPYLRVIAKKAGQAGHVLDRFHIMAHMSKAIDEVRAAEVKTLKAGGYEPVLKDSRWLLLKRPENLSEKQEIRLAKLLQYNLKTVRAYLLKEDFQFFWGYKSWYWAGRFLDRWCKRTMRSRLEPMKKVARMLRAHRPLILNWFRAKRAISSGIVEGFNNKAKLSIRKAYGFRTFHGMEISLFHALGALPEPEGTHRFC
jgi:transposase